MDVEQSIISELEELKGRFDMPYNSTDKRTIRRLYREVLGKEMRQTSCQTCYHDAVAEMFYHINHNGKMARKRKYLLKAGAMIQSADIDNGKVYTNANLTDSVAANSSVDSSTPRTASSASTRGGRYCFRGCRGRQKRPHRRRQPWRVVNCKAKGRKRPQRSRKRANKRIGR